MTKEYRMKQAIQMTIILGGIAFFPAAVILMAVI